MRVVIFGQPKSGTTYLFSLLSEVLSEEKSIVQVFEPSTVDDQKVLMHQDGRSWPLSEHMLVKILYAESHQHEGWTIAKAKETFENYDVKIFIVRDPRDRLISDFFYRWFYQHSPDPDAFERAYQLTLQKEASPLNIPFYTLYGSFVEHLEQWADEYRANLDFLSNSIVELRRVGWYILHYEDLVDRKWQSLEDILGFELKHDVAVSSALQRVSRTNTHSNWRRWFTEEDVVFLRPVLHDFLAKQNYAADDWDLEKVNFLPAEHGSAYMFRLFHQGDKQSVKPISWRRRLQKILSAIRTRFK